MVLFLQTIAGIWDVRHLCHGKRICRTETERIQIFLKFEKSEMIMISYNQQLLIIMSLIINTRIYNRWYYICRSSLESGMSFVTGNV